MNMSQHSSVEDETMFHNHPPDLNISSMKTKYIYPSKDDFSDDEDEDDDEDEEEEEEEYDDGDGESEDSDHEEGWYYKNNMFTEKKRKCSTLLDPDYCFQVIDEDKGCAEDPESLSAGGEDSGLVREQLVLDSNEDTDSLPDGWVKTNHGSGLPVYWHKASNVCTVSRPYFVTDSYMKPHKIQKSSILCIKFLEVAKSISAKDLSVPDTAKKVSGSVCKAGIEQISFKSANRNLSTKDSLLPGRENKCSENVCKAQIKQLHDFCGQLEEKIAPEINAFDFPLQRFVEINGNADHNVCIGGEKKTEDSSCEKGHQTLRSLKDIQSLVAETNNIKNKNFGGNCSNFKKNEHNELVIKCNKEVYRYCSRLFQFKKLKYLKFKSWEVRRTYTKTIRQETNQQKRKVLGTKVISLPIFKLDVEKNCVVSEDWVFNPREKSFVALLHEYLQQSLKTQPKYKFQELENAKTPFSSTVIINDVEYGTGVGKSKKDAKLKAAKNTMDVLLPNYRHIIEIAYEYSMQRNCVRIGSKQEPARCTLFDNISITDPRILVIPKLTGGLTPYEVLKQCLAYRHMGQEPQITYTMCGNQCTLIADRHIATVDCLNKQEGKQKAAQDLLQKLHPHITNWGSLLQLYCSDSDPAHNIKTIESGDDDNDDSDLEECVDRGPDDKLMKKLKRRMLNLKRKLEKK